ncbi:MAG: histidine kinase, partial [Syntrophales bacterium]|nr:histidine kinase [Syntrophales bacterium]
MEYESLTRDQLVHELRYMRSRWAGLERRASDLRQMEKSVRRSEERFKAIYRCIPIPTITWQRQGGDFVIVDYNIAAEEFSDGLLANFVGKRACLLYADRPDIREKMDRCFHEQSIIKVETPYRMFTKGDRRVIIFTFTFVPPDLVLSHMDDITGRKAADEELQRSEKQLRALSNRLLTTAENERKRIARGLHDSIGQYLTAIK